MKSIIIILGIIALACVVANHIAYTKTVQPTAALPSEFQTVIYDTLPVHISANDSLRRTYEIPAAYKITYEPTTKTYYAGYYYADSYGFVAWLSPDYLGNTCESESNAARYHHPVALVKLIRAHWASILADRKHPQTNVHD